MLRICDVICKLKRWLRLCFFHVVQHTYLLFCQFIIPSVLLREKWKENKETISAPLGKTTLGQKKTQVTCLLLVFTTFWKYLENEDTKERKKNTNPVLSNCPTWIQKPLHETCCVLLLVTCGTQTRESRYNLFTAFWNTYGGFPRLGHTWLCSPFPRVPVCRAGGPVWALMMNCCEQSKKVRTRARISRLVFKGGGGEIPGAAVNRTLPLIPVIALIRTCAREHNVKWSLNEVLQEGSEGCCWAHKTTPGFIFKENGAAANTRTSVGQGVALKMYLPNWKSIMGEVGLRRPLGTEAIIFVVAQF